ncbi:hypothetical protein L917_02916 [Phytophthora nicotianae]|nr:hypothetical protein L915_03020 [Phytophthora nicotianae]ETM00353.1 hypothetical protein L917_02916 [Phytophthora nicotianae]
MGDVGSGERRVLDVAVPVGNGGRADAMEGGNETDVAFDDAGRDKEAESSMYEETKTEDHDQPLRVVRPLGWWDNNREDDATDKLVHSLKRMGPDDDPDAYEVFPLAVTLTLTTSTSSERFVATNADDAQLIVVDVSDTESDNDDNPIGGNGASETRFK